MCMCMYMCMYACACVCVYVCIITKSKSIIITETKIKMIHPNIAGLYWGG